MSEPIKATFLALRGTTAEWNQKRLFVPMKGQLVVYTDYDRSGDTLIPGIKVGDGQTPVCSLAFTGTGITEQERQAWDNKSRCYISNDTLVISR